MFWQGYNATSVMVGIWHSECFGGDTEPYMFQWGYSAVSVTVVIQQVSVLVGIQRHKCFGGDTGYRAVSVTVGIWCCKCFGRIQ